MSAVSGPSPDAAPSGAVRAVELAVRGNRTPCAATVEKKLIKLAEGLLAAAVLAGCGIFGDGRGLPASGRTTVKRPRPVAEDGRCRATGAMWRRQRSR